MTATLAQPVSRNAQQKVKFTVVRDPHELKAFLPPDGDPDYLWILSELIRDDLTQHWAGGHRRRLIDYRSSFPELFENKAALKQVADCEFQHLQSTGEVQNTRDYSKALGIEPLTDWNLSLLDTPMPTRIAQSTKEQSFGLNTIAQTILPMATSKQSEETSRSVDEYEMLEDSDFPQVGQEFHGFQLKDILGRGSFATVYLAEQSGLSSRAVALKVMRKLGKEAGRLARMQHANICPIFSFHSGQGWQSICMPYFGKQTLDTIVCQIRESRSLPKTGQEIFSTIANRADSTIISECDSISDLPKKNHKPSEATLRGELRQILSTLSYVDATVLLVSQIADGLIHAHSLNIVHLDLKPANILLSNHGQPMLLDFNLAYDRDREERSRFGGTVPYMAPEQLLEMIQSRKEEHSGVVQKTRESLVDQRTDLFAVGVILFELLTGRHPFPISKIKESHYQAALETRKKSTPKASAFNPAVPKEVDAIITKLLTPKMAERYQSAADLRSDLLNYIENRPLVFVKVNTIVDRVKKWQKRNPRAAMGMLAASAMVAAFGAGAWGWKQSEGRKTAAIKDQVVTTLDATTKIKFDLSAPPESESSKRGLKSALNMFSEYSLALGSDPLKSEKFERLTPELRTRFANEMHDIATMAATAEGARSQKSSVVNDVSNWLKFAQSFGDAPAGDSSRGNFLKGVQSLRDGRERDAIEQLQKTVNNDPSNATAQFLLGMALMDQYRFDRAIERFDMAAALAPNDPRPCYNAGLARNYQGKMQQAESDFNEAIRRDATFSEAYFMRADCRMKMKKFDDALADLDVALQSADVAFKARHMRANIYIKKNSRDNAKKELDILDGMEPRTSWDYLIRGNQFLEKKEFTKALIDYRTSSTLNPRNAAAWNNQAHVLGERLHETESAIAAMERACQVNPHLGELQSGLGVLYARVGQRDKAHHCAQKGMLLTDNAHQIYQAACVYALTSNVKKSDADEAVVLLRKAIQSGFKNVEILKIDTDINAIRDRDDVKKILEAVKTLVN